MVYILFRETINPNETLELAVKRGLKEECDATGTIQCFLGSQVVNRRWSKTGAEVEKTTLYFLVDVLSYHPENRDKNDPESVSDILEMDIPEAIEKMKAFSVKYHSKDCDESEILERVRNII